MGTWNSRGLRGSFLEEVINQTLEKYREKNLALIQKIPTPITPIQIDPSHRHITLAYFEKKSTVDYIGVVQGIPVCFDAKECQKDSFPLANVHEHQIRFMQEFERQQGISFLLLYFSNAEQFYYMRFSELLFFVKRAKEGGRKHFKRAELSKDFFFPAENSMQIPFLPFLQKDLDMRE